MNSYKHENLKIGTNRLQIDAMLKATTMAEAVQVGVKFTNQITGLRFSNGCNK